MLTVETLILALFVNVVEVTEHFNSGDVRASIVYDAFTAVFDQVLEKLESLINLSPLSGLFLHKASIYTRHDLVEVLEVKGPLCDLLHQRRTRTPCLIVGCVSNFRFHLADIKHNILGLVVHTFDVVHGDLG